MRHLTIAFTLFSLTISSCSPKLQPIKFEDTAFVPTKEEIEFKSFWLDLIDSISKSNNSTLKNISLDSLRIGGCLLPSSTFFDNCYSEVFNKKRVALLSDTTKFRYTWTEADRDALPSDAQKRIIKFRKFYRFREIEISKVKKGMLHISLSIEFIETNEGYKFYGVSYIERLKCCR